MVEPIQSDKGPWVADLAEGDHFVGYYLARNLRLEPFRDPSRGQYLRLVLADRTGAIEARVWEGAEEVAPALEDPQVVKIEGEVELFRDRPQVRILRLRAADDFEYARGDLIRVTQRDVTAMMAEVESTVSSLRDPHLADLVKQFYDDPGFREAFQTAPAARRIHHAYLGGLLEHVYEVLLLSRPLLDLYPELNRDLLTAGVLLHDIGKLEEYTWGLDIGYTDRGRLIGHVVLGTEAVAKAIESIPGFPEDLGLQLHHMILSHHGRLEWGSPRRPKTLEAVALHYLENMDGQVNRIRTLLEPAWIAERPWTEYDRLLGRSLYAGSEDDLSVEESSYRD